MYKAMKKPAFIFGTSHEGKPSNPTDGRNFLDHEMLRYQLTLPL